MKIPYDKVAHFAGGAIVAALAAVLIDGFKVYVGGTWEAEIDFGLALLAVMFVALLKEYVYDRVVPNHTTDPMDALATMAGGVLALMFM